MANRPLSYGALQAVLKHMNANKRFEYSHQCPADHSTPLTVAFLSFGTNAVQIDDAVYGIGIHQASRKGPTPSRVRKVNRKGGLCYDVDQFGIWDPTEHLTPGDVVMGEIPTYPTHEEEIQRLVDTLEDPALGGFKEGDGGYTREEYLDRLRENLASYYCHRDNRPSPYEQAILFSKRAENGVIVEMQLYNYTCKLSEMMKALTKKLFGGRLHLIKNECQRAKHFVKRSLPCLQAIAPVLHSQFDTLECSKLDEADFESELLHGARSLTIGYVESEENWLAICQNLRNPNVYLRDDLNLDPFEKYTGLIDHWVEYGRPVGTCFSIGIKWFILNSVRNRMTERGLNYPMKSYGRVVVTFEEKPEKYRRNPKVHQWIMKIEVVE